MGAWYLKMVKINYQPFLVVITLLESVAGLNASRNLFAVTGCPERLDTQSVKVVLVRKIYATNKAENEHIETETEPFGTWRRTTNLSSLT